MVSCVVSFLSVSRESDIGAKLLPGRQMERSCLVPSFEVLRTVNLRKTMLEETCVEELWTAVRYSGEGNPVHDRTT